MRRPNLRSAATLVAAGLLASFVSPAGAAQDPQLALLAYRTTTGAASLRLQVDAPPGKHPSVITVVMATVSRGRLARIDLATTLLSGAADRAQVRAGGQRAVLCDNGVCAADTETTSAGLALSVRNEAGDDALNVVFVAAGGPSIYSVANLDGWAVKRVRLPFRWVSGEQVAPAGAYVLGAGVEAFTEASAPGGATGSIAVSDPPCSEATSGVVSRGAGTLTLDGGKTHPTFTCPADRTTLASWAVGRTTWRVHGTAAGDATQSDARLFVLDLPKTLPVPRSWPWR